MLSRYSQYIFLLFVLFIPISCELDFPDNKQGETIEVLPEYNKEELINRIEKEFEGKNILVDRRNKTITQSNKLCEITIPKGASLSEIGMAAYSDIGLFKEDYGIGGTKAAYEIMAELNGISKSNLINAGDKLVILSLEAMNLKYIDPIKEREHLNSHLLNKRVIIKSAKVYNDRK